MGRPQIQCGYGAKEKYSTPFWKLDTGHPAHSLFEIMGNKWGE